MIPEQIPKGKREKMAPKSPFHRVARLPEDARGRVSRAWLPHHPLLIGGQRHSLRYHDYARLVLRHELVFALIQVRRICERASGIRLDLAKSQTIAVRPLEEYHDVARWPNIVAHHDLESRAPRARAVEHRAR